MMPPDTGIRDPADVTLLWWFLATMVLGVVLGVTFMAWEWSTRKRGKR